MRLIRTTLWLTTIFNLAAVTMLLFPARGLGSLVLMPAEAPTLYLVIASYFVFIFGCAYAWMALQDSVIRPLLYFSAFAKSGAFLTVWVLWAVGEVSWRLAVLVVGDAIFAGIWFAWLYRHKEGDAQHYRPWTESEVVDVVAQEPPIVESK